MFSTLYRGKKWVMQAVALSPPRSQTGEQDRLKVAALLTATGVVDVFAERDADPVPDAPVSAATRAAKRKAVEPVEEEDAGDEVVKVPLLTKKACTGPAGAVAMNEGKGKAKAKEPNEKWGPCLPEQWCTACINEGKECLCRVLPAKNVGRAKHEQCFECSNKCTSCLACVDLNVHLMWMGAPTVDLTAAASSGLDQVMDSPAVLPGMPDPVAPLEALASRLLFPASDSFRPGAWDYVDPYACIPRDSSLRCTLLAETEWQLIGLYLQRMLNHGQILAVERLITALYTGMRGKYIMSEVDEEDKVARGEPADAASDAGGEAAASPTTSLSSRPLVRESPAPPVKGPGEPLGLTAAPAVGGEAAGTEVAASAEVMLSDS
ncbi:hypothetical protein EWM64_g5559 [Hericium alpestre]|uniref:Uncharacterized protein n=1 Tax=Hericium alpestre TaxID=135208 RepID=A0A4Y9ZWB8_9AGAM|nr:hypothetical protein EWM64_g5559 [Hericium alpestre]